VRGKIYNNRSRRWCKWGGGGEPLVALEIAHRRLLAVQQHMKICQDLTNSGNMVFNVEKLLNEGVDLTLGRSGGENQCEGNEQLQQVLRI
jgi:hypothetical protein